MAVKVQLCPTRRVISETLSSSGEATAYTVTSAVALLPSRSVASTVNSSDSALMSLPGKTQVLPPLGVTPALREIS